VKYGANLGVESPAGFGPATANRVVQAPALDDERLMALAYDIARGVVSRHANGDPGAQDVPIGAVAYDLTTGKAYTGYPRDRELDDRRAHAEPWALRLAEDDGAAMSDLHVATTFEPCPDCLEHMADVGVGSIVFGADRPALERRGLVKTHPQNALDIAASGREGSPYPPIWQIGSPALRAACEAVFDPFGRDPISEQVTFVGGHDHLPDFSGDVATANGNLGYVLTEAQLLLNRFFGSTPSKLGV